MTDRRTFFLTGQPAWQRFLYHRARDLETLTGWCCSARWLDQPAFPEKDDAPRNLRQDLQDACYADLIILWEPTNIPANDRSPTPYLLAGIALARTVPLLWTGQPPPERHTLACLPTVHLCKDVDAAAILNSLAA